MSLTGELARLAARVGTLETATSRVQAPSTFDEWLPATSPHLTWTWPHLAYIRRRLDDVTAGTCTRLMIFVPPRHGKTELVTIHYPAWRLECRPGLRVALACYNQLLAEKFSRRIRNLTRRRGVLALDPERHAVADWLTQAGGGLRAAGVGSGVTGQGFDLLIIDDPVKSREEANSEAYRERCWDWYKEDLYTRLEPGGAIVLIMTRWHEDDLAGRILASAQVKDWTVIRLPAEAEDGDPLGRAVGEALCPQRYDVAALADLRRTLTELPYAALFQQRPVPAGGALFKQREITVLDAVPEGTRFVRAWDVAASAGAGDYTVGALLGRLPDGRYGVFDLCRGQWASHERNMIMQAAAATDRDLYGTVKILVPQDPGSAGKDMALAFVALLAGFSVEAVRETGDKVTRADPFASQWNAGNVVVLRADWNTAYLSELYAFPFGKHDDQVDASSSAFNAVAIEPELPFGWYRNDPAWMAQLRREQQTPRPVETDEERIARRRAAAGLAPGAWAPERWE